MRDPDRPARFEPAEPRTMRDSAGSEGTRPVVAGPRGGVGASAGPRLEPRRSRVPRHILSQGANDVLNLAAALARDAHEGPGKTVFFSDITRWLDKHGKTWGDLRVDYESVILHHADGRAGQVTPETRRDVHKALTATLERDWPPFLQSLIDRGVIRAQ